MLHGQGNILENWFNIRESVNIFNHMSRTEQNKKNISSVAEKAFDKFKKSFLLKELD